MSRLRSIINVKPGEGTRTLVQFLQYFFLVAVSIAGKSARDTYFLSRYERSYLPLMFAAGAISVAIAAALYSRLSRRLSPKAMLTASNLLFLAGLLLLGMRLQGFAIPLLYLWMEITVAIITLTFWLAASEIFDPRQAKRLFGLIGGGGAMAAIIVGAGVKPCVHAFGAESLLWVVAGSLAAQWALGRHSLRYSAPQPAVGPRPRPKASGGRFDTYLTAVAVVVALSAVASQVVDYQFKMLAAETIPSEANLAGFFGHFYAFTGAATLLVQFFFTSALLTRFGLLAGLLTLPVFLSLGSIAVLLRPVLASATLGKFSDQTLRFTLNHSALELLWLVVPGAKRKTARPIVSGSVKYTAESFAGLGTYFLASYTGLRFLSLISVVALALWILAAVRLKSLYVRALVSALEKRQVDLDDLTLDVQDPALTGVIEKALQNGDEAHQLFALELIGGLPLEPWSPALRRSFNDGSAMVKQKILQLTAGEPEIFPDSQVLESLAAGGPVALEAIRAASARRLAGAEPAFRELIHSAEPEIRAAAAAALLEPQSGSREAAAAVLTELLDGADPQGRAAALPHLADRPDLLPSGSLSARLRDPSREVRESALQVAARRQEGAVIEDVIACLDDPRTVPGAQAALQCLPAGSVAPLLLNSITPDDLDSSAQAVRTLLVLARRQPLPPASLSGLDTLISALLRSAYRSNRMLKLLGPTAANTVLQNDLEDRIRQTIPIVLGMEMITSQDRSLADAVTIAADGDPARLPLLLELLDNVLAPPKRASISPLIEPLPVEERDAVGARLYSDLPADPAPELSKAVYLPREWEPAITLDYLWRAGCSELLATVNWGEVRDFDLTREMRALIEAGLPGMYSTLEKTIMLKSVSLFADIPVEKLAKIAQIVEETRMPKGAAVMREGEFGDSLFIVADGIVRVHKGGQDLAVLKKGDCVGEMALLDHSPRSADVTVEEDAALLRIGWEDFREVTAANPEIMQGIVRLLVRRLREANERLTRLAAGRTGEGEKSGKQ